MRPIQRHGFTVDSIDVFAGFGGSTQGMVKAGVEIRAAANHNELAVECHAANFPRADHWLADILDKQNPEHVNRRGKKVRGRYLDPMDLPAARIAWFSPGCKHHTQANATKIYARGRQSLLFDADDFDEAAYANSERSRATMSCVLRYVARHRPELLYVENVVEVCHWGPGRDGSTFRWWVKTLRGLGYEIEFCFLNSMFFPPCPQSRDRLYIVAWRKGNRAPDLEYRPVAYCASDRCGGKIVAAVQTWKPRKRTWPLPRWGKYERQYVYACPDCRCEVVPAAWPALMAINWSNLGITIGEREALGMKELERTTFERVRRALAKFHNYPPVVLSIGAWGKAHPALAPFSTQTTQQDKAMVCSLVPQRTDNNAVGVADEIPTLTTSGGGGHAFVAALVPKRNNSLPGAATEQFDALTTFGDQNLALMPALVEMRGGGSTHRYVIEPAHAVTAGGLHHGLLAPVLINGQNNQSDRSALEPAFAVCAEGGSRLAFPAVWSKINGSTPDATAWHTPDEPTNVVTGNDTHGIVFPYVEQFLAGSAQINVTEQLATVMSHLRHALVSVEELPPDAISDEEIRRARFRMFDPDPELRRAMAFAPDYILLGNKTQMTAGLGNAVTPPVSEWLVARGAETLGGER